MIASIFAAALALGLSATYHAHNHGRETHAAAGQQVTSTVVADVRTANPDARTALLRHEALSEFGMGAIVMRFPVAEGVDFDLFQPGAALRVTFARGESGLEVVAAATEAE